MTTILTDNAHYMAIASAIRGKNGLSASYTPSEMASAILAIPSGSSAAVLGSKSITANGTYYAQADSLDGYSEVIVDVSGGGGGGGGNEDGLIARTLSEYFNSTASVISSYVFYSYKFLRTVEMTNVETVGPSAFYSCVNLEIASFPKCQVIDSYAFAYCNSKPLSVYFPLCVSISSNAFKNCVQMVSATFPACEMLGGYVFDSCYSLKTLELPMCTTVGEYAFDSCTRLESINIQACVSLGKNAFYSCVSLSEVILPSVTSIGSAAFFHCHNLVSLNLAGVQSVPRIFDSAIFRSTPIAGYSGTAQQYGSIYVPQSLYEDFISASFWSLFSSAIVSV